MTDLELVNEVLTPFVPPEERWQPLHKNMRWAIMDLVRRVRLDEAKWWCHVVNDNEPYKWAAIGDERLRTLEQAAGGSAAK